MEIKNVKINGIKNPVGFRLDEIALSYYVVGVPEGGFEARIYENKECDKPIYTQALDYAENYCTRLNFVPQTETRYYFQIVCGDCCSERYYFETGTEFDCAFIAPKEEISHPVLFRTFETEEVVKARLYLTGLGLYSAALNGERVGNEYLAPYCNDYDAYVQYQTYDVTSLLSEKNVLEVTLGNGWYKGRFGLKHRENIYGSEYVCAAKLVLWLKNGDKRVIATDESWRARPSNVITSGIYDGEIVDDLRDCSHIGGVKLAEKKFTVTERVSLPVIVKQQISPALIISPKGEQILDFGQNFSGFVSFRCDLKHGQTVRLQAGEVLQEGCFYRDNLRTAKAEFLYTSDGVKKEVYPRFTFFGFRYMRVEGIEKVNAKDFIGNVLYSDMDETAFVTTDNEKINQLLSNCKWAQKSNFIDVPTDCPQRDERLGWTGDAEVFCPTGCYQFDCRTFYAKYCRDMAVDQEKLNGWITSYSPSFNELEESGSVWSDAATIIPWTVYQFYGDKLLLKSSLRLMERYVDALIAKDDANGGGRLYNFGFHLGDWLSQDGVNSSALRGATNEYFISSCYYYNSVKIAALAEKEMGNDEKVNDYLRVSKEIKNAILEEYFTASGRLAIDTQTAYVLCVIFEIYRNKEKLVRGFAKRMKKDGYVIKGGFVGATRLVQALIRAGLTDDAFRILYTEKFPSWLYCVNLGATTIWERWNSFNEDGSVSGATMNSFNHYSFGAVAEAFYRDISGIEPIEKAFKKVVVSPKFNYRLKKFDSRLNTPAGEFAVNYEILSDGRVNLNILVPYGVEATMKIGGNERVLVTGKNIFELPAQENLVHPFSVDSRLCDLMNNEKSAAVFRETVPGIYMFLYNNDIGMAGTTFRSLSSLSSFYVPQQTIELLDRKLREITA